MDTPSKELNCLFDEFVREQLLYRMKHDIVLEGKRIGLKWYDDWLRYSGERVILVDD